MRLSKDYNESLVSFATVARTDVKKEGFFPLILIGYFYCFFLIYEGRMSPSISTMKVLFNKIILYLIVGKVTSNCTDAIVAQKVLIMVSRQYYHVS